MANQLHRDPLSMMQPPRGCITYTPSDTVDIAHPSRVNSDGTAFKYICVAVSVAAASTLKVDTIAGDTVTVPVQAGLTPMQITRIYSTGTTLGSGSTVSCWYQ
jgi:hypothetical protein